MRIFTNREDVLEKPLQVFTKMNYLKATQMEIPKACGLSKARLVYYFPFKQNLFVVIVDKYVFHPQQLGKKFQFTAGSFPEFIGPVLRPCDFCPNPAQTCLRYA